VYIVSINGINDFVLRLENYSRGLTYRDIRGHTIFHHHLMSAPKPTLIYLIKSVISNFAADLEDKAHLRLLIFLKISSCARFAHKIVPQFSALERTDAAVNGFGGMDLIQKTIH
jgi:hypothetical protein